MAHFICKQWRLRRAYTSAVSPVPLLFTYTMYGTRENFIQRTVSMAVLAMHMSLKPANLRRLRTFFKQVIAGCLCSSIQLSLNLAFIWCQKLEALFYMQIGKIIEKENTQALSWHHSAIEISLSLMSHVRRKPGYSICEQQRHRSACTSAQSDQRLCCSLPR